MNFIQKILLFDRRYLEKMALIAFIICCKIGLYKINIDIDNS